MEPSVIEEVRLTAFKSFRDAALPLGDLTLLVGRNGSGKSNALDGLWVLSRLAHGADVREALDGGRDGPAVRGGVEGCAPLGTSSFTLGCTVRTGDDRVTLDVTVQTAPSVQVVAERLCHGDAVLFETIAPDPHSNDLRAAWASGGRSPGAHETFRASRLLTTQVFTRIPATKAGRRIHRAAAQVVAALRHVFVLDPIPNQMRQYVREGDTALRRNAENLSAAVNDLIRDDRHRERLVAALERLNEQTVVDVTTTASPLRDVMLVIRERTGDRIDDVPIRLASDGTLRFLAVLTALMQAPTLDQHPDHVAADDVTGQTTLVIEELENGLHASQARTAIDLIRGEVHSRRIRILATAHSPAVLGTLTVDEHRDVVVCTRDRRGASRLQRLVELEDYTRIVAGGGPGRAVEHDKLRDVAHDHAYQSILDVLDRVV